MPRRNPVSDNSGHAEPKTPTAPKSRRYRVRTENILTSPIASLSDWRKRWKAKRQIMYRRPSVALADYEISDTRTSAMSSLLLLFAVLEGMCGFVLPICSAFSKPTGSFKRYYYEDYLLIQYCLSILALGYLQALICYYDQKENLHQKRRSKFLKQLEESRIEDLSDSRQLTAGEEQDSYEYSTHLPRRFGVVNTHPPSLTAEKDFYDGDISEKLRTQQAVRDEATVRFESLDSIHRSSSGPLPLENATDHAPPSDNHTVDLGVSNHPTARTNNIQPKVKFSLSTSSRGSTPDEPDLLHYTSPLAEAPMATSEGATTEQESLSRTFDNSLVSTSAANSDERQALDSLQVINLDSPPMESRAGRYGMVRRSTIVPLKFLFGDDPENMVHRDGYLSRDSEGVNLYLRLGAVGFGFGVMIFDGFKIAEPLEADNPGVGRCHSPLWIPIHVLHFIYVFWQTYFLFKHHQVVFNVQKFVLRFILCHLAVANLCQWLKTIVDEISDEPPHDAVSSVNESHSNTHALGSLLTAFTHNVAKRGGHLNASDAGGHTPYPSGLEHLAESPAVEGEATHSASCRSTAKYLAPFLFPCAIEYSLIAGAMFYKMFQKIGHMREESKRLERLRQANNLTRRFAECHRSHKGLFIGLLLFMATLVTMCLFFIFLTKENKKHTAITLYQCTELVLLALSLLTCIATMIRLRVLKLGELSEEGAFDDNLLLVGLIGMVFYDLFLLVPALEAVPTGTIAARLFAAKALLEIVQSMLQVFVILEASRRCAGDVTHVRNKPGRTLITFLLILNLAMWFVNTFEVKRADNHSIHIDYYSGMAWKIITHIALPMIVFFRFHSTVCLSDIWANAYRFRTD